MPSASVQAISIPHTSARMSSRPRSHTTAHAVAAASALAMPSSLPSAPSSLPSSTLASSPPSSSKAVVCASGSKSSTKASPSLDIDIREFFPEGDATLLKFMDEASIIRAQREALEALNDAALARALRESKESAVRDAEIKRKDKGKGKQKQSVTDGDEKIKITGKQNQVALNLEERSGSAQTSSPPHTPRHCAEISNGGNSHGSADIYAYASMGNNALEDASTPVPVSDTVTREGEGTGESLLPSVSSSSSQEQIVPGSASTMPVAPLLSERYSPDEAAARMLAREWRVASLQGALFANPDMIPPPSPPVSASSSTSSSSSSSSSGNTSSTSFSSSNTTTSASSSSSSASAAARKAAVSPSRAVPMTIPAEAFYSRSSSHKRHTSSSSSSSSSRPSTASSSTKTSPPETPFVISPIKEKHTPLRSSTTMYTSASFAAAAQAAAKSSSSTTATSTPEKTRVSPTHTSFPPSSSQPTATSSSSASTSSRVHGSSKDTSSAERSSSLPRKSASSPERVRERARTTASSAFVGATITPHVHPTPAATATPGLASSTLEKTPQKTHIVSVSPAKSPPTTTASASVSSVNNGVKMSTTGVAVVPDRSSPRSSPGSSPGISPSPSQQQINPVAMTSTSASKVAAAAERARARNATKVSSASAAAAAKRLVVRPLVEREVAPSPSTLTIASLPPLNSSPSLKTTFGPEMMSPPPKVLVPSAPRDADELFSVPAKKDNEKPMVVPISSLSESDDERDSDETDDEGGEDDDGESTENEDPKGAMDVNSIPFRDLYTANRSCSKCGESIVSPRNTLLILTSSNLHLSCPKCTTLYCRGCSRPAKCSKYCSGSESCVIQDCCPRIRAIAIFEALSMFDREFLAEVGFGAGSRERHEFVQAMISKPITAQSRKLETTFVKAMNVLTEIFKSGCPFLSPASGSTGSSSLSSEVADCFERSLMPEVIHGFLRNTNVKDWITHSEIYTAILDLLRYMFEGGFVMDVPLKRAEKSCGLKEWMLGRGEIVWVSEDEDECEREREREDKEKRGEISRGQLRGGAEELVDVRHTHPLHVYSALGDAESEGRYRKRGKGKSGSLPAVPLKSLIMDLETHRGSLLEFLARVSFTPTVVKLNMLCDGISQLVLGQVLGF